MNSIMKQFTVLNLLDNLSTKVTCIFFLIFFSSSSFALVSLESVVLGDFSEKFSTEKDPLDYVFKREENLSTSSLRQFRENLSLYRGFYEEGKNLINQCKKPYEIRYESLWHKSQVKRALGATMQYLVLDLLTRSLPIYAKYFEFKDEDYKNLTENLVNNYCSENLSIISKKTLKKNFLYRFSNDSDFRLPSTDGNPLFSENLASLQNSRTVMEQEFKVALELFKSTCSWSGSGEDYGLMTPLLKHPSLFSFLVRQFEGFELSWKSSTNSLEKKNTTKVLNVWCENLICRRINSIAFKNQVYRMIGSDNLSEDLKKLYCEEILALDYDVKNTKDELLIKEMKARSFEAENILSSYTISLITGVPDFILRAKKFSEMEEVLRSSVDTTWTNWAKKNLEEVSRDVFYEEPLTFELVRNEKNFKPFDKKFELFFDINQGEFDRSVEAHGKIRTVYNLKLPTQIIMYIRREIQSLDPRDTIAKENFYKIVTAQLEGHVKKLEASFIVIPWKGNLSRFLADELIEQVAMKESKAILGMREKEVDVAINIHYGVFALKTIKHMRDVANQK